MRKHDPLKTSVMNFTSIKVKLVICERHSLEDEVIIHRLEENLCKTYILDFPGGTVVKNLPANAEDTGLIPGPGRSRMPRSN